MSNYIKMVIFLSSAFLLMFGWHFATVFGFLGSAPETRSEFFIRLGIMIGVFVVLSINSASLMLKKGNEDELDPDEREKIVELKAERNGSVFVMLSLIILMWFILQPMSPMAIANSILAILCIGEIIKLSTGLIYLRKGI